jgi:hypothetical protein
VTDQRVDAIGDKALALADIELGRPVCTQSLVCATEHEECGGEGSYTDPAYPTGQMVIREVEPSSEDMYKGK